MHINEGATSVDLMVKLLGQWDSRDHLLDVVEARAACWAAYRWTNGAASCEG